MVPMHASPGGQPPPSFVQSATPDGRPQQALEVQREPTGTPASSMSWQHMRSRPAYAQSAAEKQAMGAPSPVQFEAETQVSAVFAYQQHACSPATHEPLWQGMVAALEP